MNVIATVLGTLLAGVGSVWLAALLGARMLDRYNQHMLSLAAGVLLSTAFLTLLPEALEGVGGDPHALLGTLLGALVLFFVLDKAELWHHGHEHGASSATTPADVWHGQLHQHGHDVGHAHECSGHGHEAARNLGSWSVLAGDSVHCFGDGILIASAFMANIRLGILAAFAVLIHEVPHHMGDLLVLRGAAQSRRVALLKVSLAGSVTSLGGLAGLWLLDVVQGWLPYFLALASGSFIYVALADLIPQLQRHAGSQQARTQLAWLGADIVLVVTISMLAPKH
jgi:zinc and cadmium transporter